MVTQTPHQRILETAHDLFYEHGIRATGIDRLIRESKVTKRTFYRQFASKKELILAFLLYRHERWMSWFEQTLIAHGGSAQAIVPTMEAWLTSDDFRGCAFINSLGEMGGEYPEVIEITKNHKADVVGVIERILPGGRRARKSAEVLTMSIDGAIVRAQFDDSPKQALALLQHIVDMEMAATG